MQYVRTAEVKDAAAIAAIYNHYILHSVISFEEEVVSVEEMTCRITAIADKFPWLVCETKQDNEKAIVGYAYACPYKSRSAYRHTVETTIYLSAQHCGQGIGSNLYETLFNRLNKMDFHTAISAIALPNRASVRLHERFGFSKVGELQEIGYKYDKWIDVGYWQKDLSANLLTKQTNTEKMTSNRSKL